MSIKKGLTKNVVLMGFVSMLMDASSEMIFAILPLFLNNVLGLSGFIIGLIEGFAQSVASLMRFVSGWLSDKYKKRKLFLYIGYGFSALMKPLFALAGSWPMVLLARIGDRLGKIRSAPKDALLAESTEKGQRGKVFGFHRSMDTTGAIIGPLIALALYQTVGFRNVFWIAVIPAVLSIMLLYFVKEKKPKVYVSKKIPFEKLDSMDKEFKKFLFISGIFHLGFFSYAFLLLRAQDVGITITNAILFYLIFNISYALLSTPAGMLSDRFGKKTMIVFGYIIFGLLCLGFAYPKKEFVVVLFVVYGLVNAILNGVPRAFVSDLVEVKRATALGIYNGVVGIVALPASLIAGGLWQYFGFDVTFLFAGVISFISAFLLFMVKE